MVSEKLFGSSPPFPDDVALAELPAVSLAGLYSNSTFDIETMFQACQQYGFFLLDLKGVIIGEEMITELEAIFRVVEETMRVPEEDMMKYHQHPPRKFWGFKREGLMKTETAQQDRCTFFGVLQDDLLGHIPEVDMPEPVRISRPLLKSYIQHGQEVLSIILAGLEQHLGLPLGTLRDLQSPDAQSGTILRMIRGAPSIEQDEMRTGLVAHTDYGAVTLLANVLGGLQVLTPGASPSDESEWRWVRPRPGCLIINMGDAMVEWTGGVLRSNLHRVNYSPGDQRLAERYAVAFLVRPRQDAKMERISAGLIPQLEDDQREGFVTVSADITGLTASEWQMKKVEMLNAGQILVQSRGGRALKAATGM